MGVSTAPVCCTARSRIIHSGLLLLRMAILSLPSIVPSWYPIPARISPMLRLLTNCWISAVLYFLQMPSSLAANMSSLGNFCSCQSRQSNNLVGVIMASFGLIKDIYVLGYWLLCLSNHRHWHFFFQQVLVDEGIVFIG